MDDAACRNHPNPDLWYPETSNPYDARVREAGRICSTCPVRTECLTFGYRERHGIYGGVLMSTKKPIPVEQQLQPYRQQKPPRRTVAPVPSRREPAATQQPAAAPAAVAVKEQEPEHREPVLEPAAVLEPVAEPVVTPIAAEPVQRSVVHQVLGFFTRLLRR